MTRRERERARRAAAFIAIGEAPLSAEVEPDRWCALQRWRGDEGEAQASRQPRCGGCASIPERIEKAAELARPRSNHRHDNQRR
jgi:hypothetical protein